MSPSELVENDDYEKSLKNEGLDRSKSSSVNPCRTGNQGFKSLPLHLFSSNKDLNKQGFIVFLLGRK